MKTAENDYGRLPPPSNVNFTLINADVTTRLRGTAMQASQSMPTMGMMKQPTAQFEDMFRKVTTRQISEQRHGRRTRVDLAPHYNATIHA
jgi:hypothetical protein